jgi:vacuolar-type H+-ATPase subunit F/Vma7
MPNSKSDNDSKSNNDLYKKCIHDVRNMRVLDEEMINNIHNMTDTQKMEIIIVLNRIVQNLKEIVENNF